MRTSKPRCLKWAAWLGVIALGLNALVPVHIAFDLAAEYGAAHERSLLAELGGHHHNQPNDHGTPRGDSNGGGTTKCPVCATLATLAGFAPTSPIVLPLPPPAAVPPALATVGGIPGDIPLAYRSRAPPPV